LVFFGNALVISVVVAVLLEMTDISALAPAVGLGGLLWVGLVLTQWIGSIMGEGVPLRLAAIHAGDWLGHLLVISLVLGAWQ
ncbi:MAG: DUF1761 family protein, partial [Pseudonocardiaceae bacterium]